MKNLIALMILSVSLQAWSQRSLVDGVLAVVNDEVVLDSDLKNFQTRLSKEGMIDDLLLLGGKVDDLKKNQKAQLEFLIAEKLLDSEVRRLNLSITIERVEQEIRDIAKRNKMSRAELTQALTAQGVVLSEYQGFIKTRIERQGLLEQEITSKIRVSDEEVLAHYLKTNGKLDSKAAEFTISHIFFNPKKGGVEGATARAKEVLDKLKAGQSFDSLAEQRSEDTSFSAGGLLGTFVTGEVAQEFEEAVRGIQPGQHTDIVKTKTGVHIFKLNSRKMMADPNYEKSKEKIRAELLEKAFQKQFKNWIESKKEEAFVRINKAT